MRELAKQVEEYVNRKDIHILDRAIVNEVFYQYQNMKDCEYTEVENVNLTLEDIIKVANDVTSTYYMNEGLNELIEQWLFTAINEYN